MKLTMQIHRGLHRYTLFLARNNSFRQKYRTAKMIQSCQVLYR